MWLWESTRLIEHLRTHSLRTDGPFTLRSGAVSSWYLDARQTTFSGDGAWLVGNAVLEVVDPSAEAVGGMTMGADPIAVATAMAAASAGPLIWPRFRFEKSPRTMAPGAGWSAPLAPDPGL